MSNCCPDFQPNNQSATRGPNPVVRPLDDCNNQTEYKGAVGTSYSFGMPVKATSAPRGVEPAPDGVDAIAVSVCDKTATAADPLVHVIRTGRIEWRDIAANLGKDPLSEADWWPIHVELAKLNIYVNFN